MKTDYTNIPKEKFEFCQRDESIHDKKLETKPIGYFRDAMGRFARNKSSVVAAIILCLIFLFAIFVPVLGHNNYSGSMTDTTYLQYAKLFPKSKLFAWAGWDGCTKETVNQGDYLARIAIGEETGMNPVKKVYRENYQDPTSTVNTTYYDIKSDTYVKNGMVYMTLTEQEYQDLQAWQNETGIQVIYPAVDTSSLKIESLKSNANIWYECSNKGVPKLDKNGNFKSIYKTSGNDGGYDSLRVSGDDGSYRYAVATGSSTAVSYKTRIFT